METECHFVVSNNSSPFSTHTMSLDYFFYVLTVLCIICCFLPKFRKVIDNAKGNCKSYQNYKRQSNY